MRKKRWYLVLLVGFVSLLATLTIGCIQHQPPYLKGDGDPVHLENNSGARNRTWQEVVSFLRQDSTDEEAYKFETEGLEVYVPGSGIMFENGLCATLTQTSGTDGSVTMTITGA